MVIIGLLNLRLKRSTDGEEKRLRLDRGDKVLTKGPSCLFTKIMINVTLSPKPGSPNEDIITYERVPTKRKKQFRSRGSKRKLVLHS